MMSVSLPRWGRIALMVAAVCAIEVLLMVFFMSPLRLDGRLGGLALYVVVNVVAFCIVFMFYRHMMQARHDKLIENETHTRILKEQLEQQTQTLNAVLNAAPDMIVLHDMAGRVTYANPSVLSTLGLKLQDMIGKNWDEIVQAPNLFIHNQAMFNRAYQTRLLVRYESLRVPTSAGLRDYEIILNPMCEVDGQVNAVMLMARDITERKRTEAALVASEQRYRVITELISDYAYSYLIEPDGNIKPDWITEEPFIRLTGYTLSEVETMGAYAFYLDEDKPRAKRDIAATIKGETGVSEYRIMTKSGEIRWVRIFRRPLWDEAQGRVTRFFGVAQDVTIQKQAEEQRLRLTVERERLMVINRFMDAFSHYFRNQLATIESGRYLIERTTANSGISDLPRRLEVIRESVVNMRDQLDNLRVVSSMTVTTPIACNLNHAVELVASEFEGLMQEKHLSFVIDTSATLPFAWASPSDLQMALRHLIANALTYTPEDGTVTVRTVSKNGKPCVEVSDTGIGIPEDQISAVFELFYKADPAKNINQGCVGLGLSIVRLIAETYSGKISVISKLGEGSTFTLELMNADGFNS